MRLAVLTLAFAFALALAPAPAHAASVNVPVTAAGFSFITPVVVVPVGSTVTWTSQLLPHTVTTDDGGANSLTGVANDPSNSDGNPDTWNAGLPQGGSFSHTFATGGVFSYHCELHHTLGMIGVVVVLDPNMLP